jgi:HPt (histidine-containing phosphotransfer) domain-containing protein
LKAFLKKCKSGEEAPEFFITVIDEFLSNLPRHLKGIKQALERQNSEALVKTVHGCKGSSPYIGALPFAEIRFSLKTLGHQGTTLGAKDFLSKFRPEQNRVIEALNKKDFLSTP